MTDQYKVITLGDSTVGKTSISNRLIKNIFNINTGTTIGATYTNIKLEKFDIGLWDTAGQERFLSLVNFYYRNTFIYLMIYDVSNMQTLKRILYYLNNIKDTIDENAVIFIIGNKMDLINTEIDTHHIGKLINMELGKNNMKNKIEYYFVSAKSGQNINILYNDIIKYCSEKYATDHTTENRNIDPLININSVDTDNYFNKCLNC